VIRWEAIQPIEVFWLLYSVPGMVLLIWLHHLAERDRADIERGNGAAYMQSQANVWTYRLLFSIRWLLASVAIPALGLVPRTSILGERQDAYAIAAGLWSPLALVLVLVLFDVFVGLKLWNRIRMDRYLSDAHNARYGRRRTDPHPEETPKHIIHPPQRPRET
jgi:hypothetical protein